MPSIWPQLKTCFVFPDGDGGYVLQVMGVDGHRYDWPLTPDRALELCTSAGNAARDMLRAEKNAAKANNGGPVNATGEKFLNSRSGV